MKKYFGIGLLFAALVLGFYLVSIFDGSDNVVTGKAVDTGEDAVKTFVVESSHLRFYIDGVENPEIKVKEGDRVRIEFSSEEGFHDFVIDEFGVATEKVSAGSSSSVEFVADKKGTFEYYCSVGKHRANGMFGKFIVE